MIVTTTDLEKVDPRGRVDVLAFRGAEHLVRKAESHYGLQGLWDALKPHINTLAVKHISGVEIPTEAKVLLSILQANYKPDGM
jgi:hypothetical protein